MIYQLCGAQCSWIAWSQRDGRPDSCGGNLLLTAAPSATLTGSGTSDTVEPVEKQILIQTDTKEANGPKKLQQSCLQESTESFYCNQFSTAFTLTALPSGVNMYKSGLKSGVNVSRCVPRLLLHHHQSRKTKPCCGFKFPKPHMSAI